MADTVDTLVSFNGARLYQAKFNCVSDGTGETNVVKIDISTLRDSNHVPPTSLRIMECAWNIQGFTYVQLLWDRSPKAECLTLNGNGYQNFEDEGPLIDAGTGGTGSILLTSVGAVSGATYEITLKVML